MMMVMRHRTLSLIVVLLFTSNLFAADDNRPVVDDSKFAAEQKAANQLPTLFLVGDSTLHSPGASRGWAQEIGAFFDKSKINIVDRAIGGRSSKTFITEGKWDQVL